MLDIKFIKENKEAIQEAAKLKKIDISISDLLDLYAEKVKIQQDIDEVNKTRNELAAQSKTSKPTPEIIAQGKELKNNLAAKETELTDIDSKYLDLMVKVPNIASPDTPIGKDENDNITVYTWGKPTQFAFEPKDHMQLAKDLDLFDFERGVKVSGYRGYYVKNEAVQLQLGLMMYALNKAIIRGFKPVIPPTLVREFALFGTGYFAGKKYDPEVDEIYKVSNQDKEVDGSVGSEDKFLIGTAEPSLLAYYANEVLEEQDLPVKFCGFSPCYRSEIGSYGKDTKGLFRVHEFMKVELVAIATDDVEKSDALQDELLAVSKEMHEELGLPYRQIQICTGDLSAGKRRQFDLEAWIPSRNGYGETGSASNFLTWQSQRLNVKYKSGDERKYPIMLNNTAIPSPRILIAILENYQQADGSILIPKVLQPSVGLEVIKSHQLQK